MIKKCAQLLIASQRLEAPLQNFAGLTSAVLAERRIFCCGELCPASLHAYSGSKGRSLAQIVSFQKKDLITLSSNPELPVWRVEVRRIGD